MEGGSSSPNTGSGSSDSDDEPTVETAESLAGSIMDLINHNGIENTYVEIPDVNIENIIASNSEIRKGLVPSGKVISPVSGSLCTAFVNSADSTGTHVIDL